MPPSSDTDEFRRILSGSHDIVVIAGAGLSAGSGEISDSPHLHSNPANSTGIPTFRTGNGLWQSHDVTKLATPEAFASNPALVWQFYHERRRAYVCPLSRPFILVQLGYQCPLRISKSCPLCSRCFVNSVILAGCGTELHPIHCHYPERGWIEYACISRSHLSSFTIRQHRTAVPTKLF